MAWDLWLSTEVIGFRFWIEDGTIQLSVWGARGFSLWLVGDVDESMKIMYCTKTLPALALQ